MSSISFDDLTSHGARGEETRRLLIEGIDRGDTPHDLLIKMATASLQYGKPSFGLWFLAHKFDQHIMGESLSTLLTDLMTAASRSPVDPIIFPALTKLLPILDRLQAELHCLLMRDLCNGMVSSADTSQAFLQQFSEEDFYNKSPSFLVLRLAVAQAVGDLETCKSLTDALRATGSDLVIVSQILAKSYAALGDYEQCEKVAREAAWLHSFNRSEVSLVAAAAMFCNGKETEARIFLDKFYTALNSDILKERQKTIRKWVQQLDEAMENDLTDGLQLSAASGDTSPDLNKYIGAAFNYTEENRARGMWHLHRQETDEKNNYLTICAHTNLLMFDRIEALLNRYPALTKILNYGSLCGLREDLFSQRHPDHIIAGYDISEVVTELNQSTFQRDNLLFGSDLDGLLEELAPRPEDTLMAHCRSMDVMLPAAVKAVYRACHAHGVSMILAAEYFDISKPILNYPDLSGSESDSVHWDGILVMHNYDKIMPETGYRIVESGYVPTSLITHTSDEGITDSQLIQFVLAERMDA